LGATALPKVNREPGFRELRMPNQLGPIKFPSSFSLSPKTGNHAWLFFSLRCSGLTPARAVPHTCSHDLSFTWRDAAGSNSANSCRRQPWPNSGQPWSWPRAWLRHGPHAGVATRRDTAQWHACASVGRPATLRRPRSCQFRSPPARPAGRTQSCQQCRLLLLQKAVGSGAMPRRGLPRLATTGCGQIVAQAREVVSLRQYEQTGGSWICLRRTPSVAHRGYVARLKPGLLEIAHPPQRQAHGAEGITMSCHGERRVLTSGLFRA